MMWTITTKTQIIDPVLERRRMVLYVAVHTPENIVSRK
jgi:hypothetical protein